jgi:hypothetical protein
MFFFMLQLCQFSELVLSLEFDSFELVLSLKFDFLRLVILGFGEELLFEVFFEGSGFFVSRLKFG